MKRRTLSRKKRVVRKVRRAPYVPKPEVKILQHPILDLDTNQTAPAVESIPGGIAVAGSVSQKNMTVFIPQNWRSNVQGTAQDEIIGRRMYVQSMKQMFRFNFDGCRNNPVNPRFRIIHGWCVAQTLAQGSPMNQSPNIQPVSTWGQPTWYETCVKTNLAQQLQFKLTTPNTKVIKVLSDRSYFARGTAGASDGTQMTFNRVAIEFTKYWPMKRQLNLKEAPAAGDPPTASDQMVPQMQEPIPFLAVIWDNASDFSLGTNNDVIHVEHRAQLRVLDN